jgi:aldehyde dehydrogenase (NAD+)
MREYLKFYINGEWSEPVRFETLNVINPATEKVAGRIAAGSSADVDKAAAAARMAFNTWGRSSCEERLDVLRRVIAEYEKRSADLAAAITEEMGAPASLAQRSQVPLGLSHLAAAAEILKAFRFEEHRGPTMVVKEPIGVCAFITPWNWPINQIACKVAPALATGCSMILKPSEVAPFSAQIFAEIMHAAGVPRGVFNMIQGTGPQVGVPLSSHPQVDMVSFTGSTRAGIEVAKNAAPTVKRVHQELGGKSPNIILDDALLPQNVARGVAHIMNNSGQSCNAPSRMLVPLERMNEAIAAAKGAADKTTVGDPRGDFKLGPVASEAQWNKIQRLIAKGLEEGAALVAGGLGRPDGLKEGYFVKPTIFANVTNDMTIAREEIFGPVLSILGYSTLDEAIALGNDTEYGLAAYVSGADHSKAREVAAHMRAGQVSINGASDMNAPFGGFKMSGNGREWGDHAFDEFLEIKAVLGFTPKPKAEAASRPAK